MKTYAQQLKALHQAIVHGDHNDLTPIVKPMRGNIFSVAERIDVYTYGYKERLTEATLADYPALSHYMGKESLKEAIKTFVKQTPSCLWDLNRYPIQFADFLVSYTEDEKAHALAKLEASVTAAFWQPENDFLAIEQLQKLDGADFSCKKFSFSPDVYLLDLNYTANQYLTFFRQGITDIRMEKQIEYLLICRPQYEVLRIPLEAQEYQLLSALKEGKTLEETLESAMDQESLAENFPVYLNRWIENKIFAPF